MEDKKSVSVAKLKEILVNEQEPMAKRFRCIFTLKNIGGNDSVEALAAAMHDPSDLLKHEIAYVLGQMRNPHAVPYLKSTLENISEHPMVRHEAAEALGAIGLPETLAVLEKYLHDSAVEVRETCEIAIARIRYQQEHKSVLSDSPYATVDPAPAFTDVPIEKLRAKYLNTSKPLFTRYRAMFALRDKAEAGSTEAIEAIIEGLKDSSALFRHEVAFVLGQLQHPLACDALTKSLENGSENCMVRHEAAEALGAIASNTSVPLLTKYSTDSMPVVKESCVVALDIHKYFTSNEFQYADGLTNIENKDK